MAQDVTLDRNLYIGGSDIPIIMGISPFKKRFDLLLEKAGLQENEFQGNAYTEYGNILEPKIRDFINENSKKPFKEDKKIIGEIRCHVDGFNEKDTILEIKTTSQIHNEVNDYKVYLVQLLFYMFNYEVKKGKLAIYERPADFNELFEPERLQEFDINIKDYKELVEDILDAVERFKIDLEKVKANPFITEEELQPKELILLSNQVTSFETKLAEYKVLEEQYKEVKAKLYEEMGKYKIKKWTTNSGIQISRVDEIPSSSSIKSVFNADKFKEENPELYKQYEEEKIVTSNGRAGYVKITLPKK